MQKVTISGSYRTKNKEVVDFQDVTGLVPDCDEDVLESVLRTRYAKMWLTESKKYKDRVYDKFVREVYIDNVEKADGEPKFVGKNLKELTFEEMQDLATAKWIRDIPIYRSGSLRAAQLKCYKDYVKATHGEEVDDDLKFADYKDIILDNGETERDFKKPMSPDEYLDLEEKRFSMDIIELKKVADAKGIDYHSNIGFDKLYSRVYG